MFRRAFCPTIDTLAARNLFHENPKEVSGVATFAQNCRLKLLWIDAGNAEHSGLKPKVKHFLTISSKMQIATPRSDQIEHFGLAAINGKTACGKQHMVQKSRSCPRGTED